jgi:hypothetical protein
MTVITASPKSFARLVELQQDQLTQVKSIRELMDSQVQAGGVQVQKDSLDVQKSILDAQRDAISQAKESAAALQKIREDELQSFKDIADSMKTTKTLAENLKGFKGSFKELFSGNNLAKNLMEGFNFKGLFNKSIEKIKFVDRQKAMGSKDSDAMMKQNFENAWKLSKQIKENDEQIKKMKDKLGGNVSDQALKSLDKGKELLDNKDRLSSEYSKYDKRTQLGNSNAVSSAPLTSGIGGLPQSATDALAEDSKSKEMTEENAKRMDDQTSLLQQIAANTSKSVDNSSAGGREDAGGAGGDATGGLLGGIGAGLKSLGTGLQSLLKGAGRGIQGFLQGLASGLAALANPATLVGLAAATLSIMGIGKALGYAAPFMEAFAPVLIKIADVVENVFVAAIQKIPDIIRAVGDVIMGVITVISGSIVNIIDAVTSSIERLSAIDGNNLLSVGAGLLAVAGGLAAFGGATAVAGVGNLVGGFLSAVSGQKSPVDQIMDLANGAQGITNAATGLDAIGTAMMKFSNIDPKSMKAINDFPWLRATAFVAAGGSMQVDGSKVYNASKSNADEGAKVEGKSKGSSNTIVNAPKTSNSKTTNVASPPIRNQESTQSRYIQSKYS